MSDLSSERGCWALQRMGKPWALWRAGSKHSTERHTGISSVAQIGRVRVPSRVRHLPHAAINPLAGRSGCRAKTSPKRLRFVHYSIFSIKDQRFSAALFPAIPTRRAWPSEHSDQPVPGPLQICGWPRHRVLSKSRDVWVSGAEASSLDVFALAVDCQSARRSSSLLSALERRLYAPVRPSEQPPPSWVPIAHRCRVSHKALASPSSRTLHDLETHPSTRRPWPDLPAAPTQETR